MARDPQYFCTGRKNLLEIRNSSNHLRGGCVQLYYRGSVYSHVMYVVVTVFTETEFCTGVEYEVFRSTVVPGLHVD